MVIGHCVNASPAKIVSPILSFGRELMNSLATAFAASMRLGSTSSDSILADTSRANIMLIPSTCSLSMGLLVCGRAKTTTIRA